MDDIDNSVEKLNSLLMRKHINTEYLIQTVRQLIERKNIKFKILDFHFYNEDRLQALKAKKIKAIQAEDYEFAIALAKKEEQCLNYIKIREDYIFTRSIFYYEKDYLLYLHFGVSDNDKKVNGLLKKQFGL